MPTIEIDYELPKVGRTVEWCWRCKGDNVWHRGVVSLVWFSLDEVAVDVESGAGFLPKFDEWRYVY